MRRRHSFAKLREDLGQWIDATELDNQEVESARLSGKATVAAGRRMGDWVGDVATLREAFAVTAIGGDIFIMPGHTENFS